MAFQGISKNYLDILMKLFYYHFCAVFSVSSVALSLNLNEILWLLLAWKSGIRPLLFKVGSFQFYHHKLPDVFE